MLKSEKQENQSPPENQPPPGYPVENPPPMKKRKCRPGTKKRGEKGCIEVCLAALCCCWICEECC